MMLDLRGKIISSILIMNILVASVFAYYLQTSYMHKQTYLIDLTKNASVIASENIFSKIDKIDTLLFIARDSLLNLPGVLSLENRSLEEVSKYINIRLPTSGELYFITPGGNLIDFNQQKLVNVSDRDYFKKHLEYKNQNKLIIGNPIISKISGKEVITFSRNLQGRNGEFIGIVIVSIEASYLKDILMLSAKENTTVSLQNDLNVIIKTNNVNTHTAKTISLNDINNYSLIVNHNFITTISKIEPHSLFLIYSLNTKQEMQSWYAAAYMNIFLLCILMLISIAGGAVLITYINKQKRALIEANTNKEKLELSIKNAPIAMAIINDTGRIITTNQTWRNLLGISSSTLIELCDDKNKINDCLTKLETQHSIELVLLGVEKNIDTKVSLAYLSKETNEIIVQVEDLTAIKENEKILTLSKNVYDNSSEGIVVTDDSGKIISINAAFETLTGYSQAELIGTYPSSLAPYNKQKANEIYTKIGDILKKGHIWRGELEIKRKDGDMLDIWLNASAIKNNGKVINLIGMYADITEHKKNQKQIEFLAYHDALTGLPNRVVAYEEFKVLSALAKAQSHQMAVLFLDLDGFKSINDTLGHHVGDMLIKDVAHRIQKVLTPENIICRQGGDEFLIILSDIKNTSDISEIAKRLLSSLNEPFNLDTHIVPISTSIGIARYPEHGETFEELMKKADTAMYSAKSEGKNTFRFYENAMASNLLELLDIRKELHHALEYDRGQFVLYYQPQISVKTGRVIGAEALIRWIHPERGMISPADFIPVAEDSGLIIQIGELVLEEACKQAFTWQSKGLTDVTIAINLSAVQLKYLEIVDTVRKILELTGLPPSLLELEVTESAIVQNDTKAYTIMKAFQEMGINMAIDDFGTGYSTFTYLKKFVVNKIKLDRSFVSGITTDMGDIAIVNAIIKMSKQLGVTTVAEGVECKEILNALHVLECDDVQGFLFSKPLPLNEFIKFTIDINTKIKA